MISIFPLWTLNSNVYLSILINWQIIGWTWIRTSSSNKNDNFESWQFIFPFLHMFVFVIPTCREVTANTSTRASEFTLGFVLYYSIFTFLYSVLCFSFSFWPLHCLSFDLRLLITPLVSSNLYLIHISFIFW